jgi:hypothetical protein
MLYFDDASSSLRLRAFTWSAPQRFVRSVEHCEGRAMRPAIATALLLVATACWVRRGEPPRSGDAAPGVVPGDLAAPAGHAASGGACAIDDAPRAALESSLPPRWLAGEERHGPCDSDEERGEALMVVTERAAVDPFTLRAAGPSGSGHHWEVAVSWPSQEGTRGFCFLTSSSGWRQIGADKRLAESIRPLIEWLQDVDGDGRQELVVRSTLELSGAASLDEVAITLAAYDRAGDRFELDAGSTRTLREKLAQAYQVAADRSETQPKEREHFERAAARLRSASCAP